MKMLRAYHFTGKAGAFMDEKTTECYEQLAYQTARQIRDMISYFKGQKKDA